MNLSSKVLSLVLPLPTLVLFLLNFLSICVLLLMMIIVDKYNYRYLPWADQLEVMHKHVPSMRDTDAFFVRKLIDPAMGDVILREVLPFHS